MSVRVRAVAAGLLAAGAALLPASDARAYCRTTTCDPNLDACEKSGICITSGLPLYWPSSCATFSVEAQGSIKHGISADEAESVAQRAFAAWLDADCGGGTAPTISVEPTERARCSQPEYNTDGGNANVLIFQDEDWPENSEHALALTTVWFNPDTGRIYDVDVEVNGVTNRLTTTTPRAGADLQSILTHEFGHFLGLSHSSAPGAVMRTVYAAGDDDLRTLTADDRAGVCAIYPASREIPRAECGPRHGFASGCGDSGNEKACSVGAVGGATRWSSGLLATGLGLTLLLARARRTTRATRRTSGARGA